MKKLIFIVGPTATGKSDLSVELAKKINAEIISCDSMQIYQNMDIGTAKVTQKEMCNIPHHMIDIVNANSNFDVSTYQKSVESILHNLDLENKTAIITGGTGLYVNSIIYPMTFGKSKDSKLRKDLTKFLEENGKEALFAKLVEVDENSSKKLHINDTKRVIRAIEITMDSDLKSKQNDMQKPRFEYIMVGLNTDRQVLYNRINNRVDKMFSLGLENEVKSLLENNLVNFDCQSMQAIGYKEFLPYFNGEISKDELIELIKKNSRNYAKRQITWFKKYENIKWFDCINERTDAIKYIMDNME